MRKLSLYPGSLPSRAEVELCAPLDRDSLPDHGRPRGEGLRANGRDCDRCALHKTARTRCVGGEGEPGGVLLVGEGPGRDEDALGRPFIGQSGKLLRVSVAEHWTGPIAIDNAMRCYSGKVEVKPKHVDACRPFLAQTILDAQPKRIVALGAWAAYALLGRSVPPLSARRGYSWLRGNWVEEPIPIYLVLHPAAALRNEFIRKWFYSDLKWALTNEAPPRPPWDAIVRIIETEVDAREAYDELLGQEFVSFDVETVGTMFEADFDIVRITLTGSDNDDGFQWDWEALQNPAALAVLLDIMTSKRFRKGGQNVKYDQLAVRVRWGKIVKPIVFDTRLMRKLLDAEASGKLGVMAELIGMGGLKEEAAGEMAVSMRAVRKALRKPPATGPLVPELELPASVDSALRLGADPSSYRYAIMKRATLDRYNARDSVATGRLAHYLSARLSREPNLQQMWERIILPGTIALEQVEAWGVAASKDAIKKFDDYLAVREEATKRQLDVYPDVNWDSPKQVGDLLFGKLGLKPLELTATQQPSTAAATLERLRGQHPVIDSLLDHRAVTKLRGTYAQGMYAHVRSDGRIHPNIKLDGARSGRTSCTDPNLQNIPRPQSVEGKMARDVFVAPPGYVLLEGDYSQLELRVAAMLSQDQKMIDIFKAGTDYHLRTAQMVSMLAWGLDPSKIEDKHRTYAKTVNFGVLYGKSAKTLAEEWGVSKAKAQLVYDAILGEFKDLNRWCQQRVAEAKKTSFVWTWWEGDNARRRPLFRVRDADDYTRSVAEHGAINSPIQGTASDFCIASLTACVDWILQDNVPGVKLILPIHDALMFQVREDMVEEVASTVNHIMTSWDSAGVPLVADFKVGHAWGSMEKFKVA